MGRLLALTIVAACVFFQTLPDVLDWRMLLGVTGVSCVAIVLCCAISRCIATWYTGSAVIILRTLTRIFILLTTWMIALSWANWRAEIRLKDQLETAQENVVTRVSFLITGLIQDQGDSFRFEAQVQVEPQTKTLPVGIPRNIQVVWPKPGKNRFQTEPERFPNEILPGQQWRAALIFRRPRTALNPHGFDYEAHLLSRNIRAIGRVRGHPVLLAHAPFSSLQVMVSSARQRLRAAMREHVGQMKFGAVLIALAIGDQDSVQSEHWDIFNKTGITHLVSISGSHVTMLAAFGGLSMLWCWKRLRWRGRSAGERIPAKVAASIAALVVAWLYCLLAGWGVPARRTFFMLLVSGLLLILRLPTTPSSVLCLAAAVVTVIDPWSPVTTGFWLSFGAVAVLFYVGNQSQDSRTEPQTFFHRLCIVLKVSARLQWIITLAMLPALAFLFQQVSLSSPFANAVAIPVVTFVVTPLALISAVLSAFPGLSIFSFWTAWLAHISLEFCMVPVTWLAQAPWLSLTVGAMPVWMLTLSILGIVWALQPPGVPIRWVGWTLLLPALTWQPQKPGFGEWRLIALDVGQGGSVLLQTQNHTLLFDAGPKLGDSDAGQRVVIPLLRALGVRYLDTLVISHSDVDHAGGVPGILREIPVRETFSSFDLPQWLEHTERVLKLSKPVTRPPIMSACLADTQWEWDGVIFRVLHPQLEAVESLNNTSERPAKKKVRTNAKSCVLYVQGRQHAALMPGDIGVKQEESLMQNMSLKSDVVVVPHHGSLTSSAPVFVTNLQAQHAIAQSGYLNRFSHPAHEVERRWRQAKTEFWRTDNHGAVTVESSETGLRVYTESVRRKRYWHQRD